MYLFYVDESGNRDADLGQKNQDGTYNKDWLYVVTAVGIFGHRWKEFYRTIVGCKRELLRRIRFLQDIELDLDSTEIKSNWVRVPKERAAHPFLRRITDAEITTLVSLYFDQLEVLPATVISVVIDKRHLRGPPSQAWLHAKAWELLCERVELFMRKNHPRHRAMMIADDMGKQQNCALAMRHAHFLEKATTANRRLQHIVEMPLFVRSELSEGVQLADLCGYSVYRAFRNGDLTYHFFQPVLKRVYGPRSDGRFEGLKIFPPSSPLHDLLKLKSENEEGSSATPNCPLELTSGGANPIKLQAAPDLELTSHYAD
jgi:hypothetical protein